MGNFDSESEPAPEEEITSGENVQSESAAEAPTIPVEMKNVEGQSPVPDSTSDSKPGGTAPNPVSDLESDDVVRSVGEYQVQEKIGSGSMGEVFRARQVALDRIVALKILSPQLASDGSYVDRFRNEAALAAKLNHPGIVQIYSAGETDGRHYLEMEFVDGESLREHLNQVGPLSPEAAVRICLSIAEALSYAWEKASIIHRDIKPDNIFLTSDGTVKVGDLGLAKELDATSSQLTQSGALLGTPCYMSPEQIDGKDDVDFRTDVYSLGCTLYHMLVGKPPFEGKTITEVLVKHAQEAPSDIRTAVPGCTPEIAKLTGRMLEKSPADRHKCYEELIGDLQAVADPGARTSTKRSWRIVPLVVAGSILFCAILLSKILDFGPGEETAKAALHSAIEHVSSLSGEVLSMAYGGEPPTVRKEHAPPALGIDVLARRNGTGPFVPLVNGDSLASGVDEYVIALQAYSEGHLYVFQIDSSGNLDWLFPKNEASDYSSGSNPVGRSQGVRIPSTEQGNALFLDGNLGVEHIYVVFCTAQWTDFEEILAQARAPAFPTRSATYISRPFGLETRGVGGIRTVDESLPLSLTKSGTGEPLSGEMIQSAIHTGSGPLIVVERWFHHVAPDNPAGPPG